MVIVLLVWMVGSMGDHLLVWMVGSMGDWCMGGCVIGNRHVWEVDTRICIVVVGGVMLWCGYTPARCCCPLW